MQFPAEYNGSIFAAEHGSWNRAKRTGYKIIRGIMKDGVPTGEYEDFVTGFVIDDSSAWGRPVGVAQMKDGSLLFSEDGNGTIWRVTYTVRRSERRMIETYFDHGLRLPMLTPLAKRRDVLAGGGLVAFPTETVYGLGADATNDQRDGAGYSRRKGGRRSIH